jgi:alpha-mannosidase
LNFAGLPACKTPRPSYSRLLALSISIAATGGLIRTVPVQAQVAKPSSTIPAPKPVDVSKEHVLYMIGYSHLDTEWVWNYPQVINEFIPNTFNENYPLFEKYPDYIFNWTGSNRYKFMKEYYPEDYARIKSYIKAGKWFPGGSSVEEGDVNSPSPESIIRQIMYGNQYFRREFGRESNEYMLPDCFGFPASLPSIIAHTGLTGFSTQKLSWGSAIGIPFNIGTWVGPDGQSVIAALNGGAYDKKIREDLSQSKRMYDRIDANGKKSGVYADYIYYGQGDRGGSAGEESVDWIDKSIKGNGPVKVIGARSSDLFSILSPQQKAALPSYQGDLELTWHSAGSITSQAMMKRWNRKNELLGASAEQVSVAAALLGAQPYPMTEITDAWLRFLPGQFHDIMAGTCLPEGYEYAWNDQILALNRFSDVVTQGVGGVARALDTRAKGVPLVVYNPLSFTREDVVEAMVTFPGGVVPKGVRVIGPDGKAVPAQIAGTENGKVRILFLAKVPSASYTSFDVQPAASASPAKGLTVTQTTVENERYRVRLAENGDVASVYDKAAKKEMLAAPARLAFQYERPRDFPAWNMDWEDQQKPPRAYVDGPAKIRIVENGPARVALEVERQSEGSRFIQTIRLAAGGDRVEFATHIDWRTGESALKAVFPLTVSNPKATYSWGIGTIQRGNNDPRKYEVPAQQWFDLTDTKGQYGVSVLDDSKYGSDKPDDNTVRLTLLYTPGVRGGYQHQGSQDWGRHEMVYALKGHQGNWRTEKSSGEAARLNQPLLAFQTPAHAGPLGRSFSLLTVSGGDQVRVAALKRAEDSDEIIVRLFEMEGKPAKNVRLAFASPILSAREVNGQEKPLATTPAGIATVKNGALVFDMTAYRPRAFALKLGKAPSRLMAPKATPLSLPFNADVASSWTNKTDGKFDPQGRTIPGELLPATLESGGILFKLGRVKDGAKNAVIAMGQKIPLPAGTGKRRVYLLAAAYGGDTPAIFMIGSKSVPITIQNWGGYVGQWDNREWEGEVPQLTYSWSNPIGGLVPGYIKRDTVAWCSDHWRLPDGKNEAYRFCYLFRYAIDVPSTATTLTLPKNQKVRILAATLADNPNDDTKPAIPLYDTLSDHKKDVAAVASPPGGTFHDAVPVSLSEPLYWSSKNPLRYTTDGTAPTAASPVYKTSLTLTKSATLKFAAFTASGKADGPVSSTSFTINDTTAPKIISASAIGLNTARVVFSEPVTKATAEQASLYTFQPANRVQSAKLAPDNRTVLLTVGKSLPQDGASTITALGVKDQSANGNPTLDTPEPLTLLKPVFALDTQTLNGSGEGLVRPSVPALPIKGADSWTINQWVYLDKEPEELTLLSGFGDGGDNSGQERFLVKFKNSIHFWGSNIDISAGQPFDIGKWQMVTITFDGSLVRLYKNGKLVHSEPAVFSDAEPTIRVGTASPWGDRGGRFDGKIAGFTIWREALPADFVQTLLTDSPVKGAVTAQTAR